MDQVVANARGVDRSRRWRAGITAKLDHLVEEQGRLASAVEQLAAQRDKPATARKRKADSATGDGAAP